MANDWDYNDDGECGPQNWLKLYGTEHCGDHQSPIDLQLSNFRVLSLDQDPLRLINYDAPLPGEFFNNGYSVQFLPDLSPQMPEIQGGQLDQPYRFIQYHFHWAQNDNEGSEHTIGGLRYPAELHLVHQGVEDPTKLAVLGIFLKIDNYENAENLEQMPFKTDETAALRQVSDFNKKAVVSTAHNLLAKIPLSCFKKPNGNPVRELCAASYVRYEGSLTTPPCSENVIWTVFTDPIPVTKEQLSLLRAVKDRNGSTIQKNYRPVQKVNDRSVFLVTPSSA